MNRRIGLSLLLLMPFMALAQQSYTLTGDLGEEFETGKAYLQYRDGSRGHKDSTMITKGKFTFSGQVHKPERALLLINRFETGTMDFTELYLESGEITIVGIDSVSTAVLAGTSLNVDQGKLNQALIVPLRKLKASLKEMKDSKDENNDSGFRERGFNSHLAIQKEINEIRLDFIKENPNSLVSLDLLLTYAGHNLAHNLDLTRTESLLNSLSPELQKDPRIVGIRKQLEAAKNLEIGGTAPGFTQNDPDGNPISLSSFYGKYVLIDFWASWCMPCRQENPNLVAAYHKFKDKNFTILGVSLDRENGRDAWLNAIEDDQLDWTQVSDLKFWNNEVAKLYGVRGIPQSYLLDPSGKIIGINLRGEELHRKLAEILD